MWQPSDTAAQSFSGNCKKGKKLHGMVLWLQTSPCYPWSWGAPELVPNPRKCGWPQLERHETPDKRYFREGVSDKGYVSKKRFEELLERDVELITKQKRNAKKQGMMRFADRLFLRKRAMIESVNDFLKNTCQIEHSRNRSRCNFVVNLVAGLCAYSFLPKKPSIHTGNMTFA